MRQMAFRQMFLRQTLLRQVPHEHKDASCLACKDVRKKKRGRMKAKVIVWMNSGKSAYI